MSLSKMESRQCPPCKYEPMMSSDPPLRRLEWAPMLPACPPKSHWARFPVAPPTTGQEGIARSELDLCVRERAFELTPNTSCRLLSERPQQARCRALRRDARTSIPPPLLESKISDRIQHIDAESELIGLDAYLHRSGECKDRPVIFNDRNEWQTLFDRPLYSTTCVATPSTRFRQATNVKLSSW
jgi:hypothetical protein